MVELKHAPTKEGGLNLRVPNGNVALVIVGILDKHEWGSRKTRSNNLPRPGSQL